MSLETLAAEVLLYVGTVVLLYDLSEYVAKRISEGYFKTVYDDVLPIVHFSLIMASVVFEPFSISYYAQLSDSPVVTATWLIAGLALYALASALIAVLRVAVYRAGVRTKQNRLDDQSLGLGHDDRGNA